MRKICIILLLLIISSASLFAVAKANTVKVNLGSDYIPEKDPAKANAMCNLYPNGAYKCFCKNGHYKGDKRDYVWSSQNPKPDDNMLNTYPLYVRTPNCLKFYKD